MNRERAEEQRPGGFTVAWLLWLAVLLVVEGVALLNRRKGDTLSEHAWEWFSVRDQSTAWRTLRFAGGAAFLGWLLIHIVTGGWV